MSCLWVLRFGVTAENVSIIGGFHVQKAFGGADPVAMDVYKGQNNKVY